MGTRGAWSATVVLLAAGAVGGIVGVGSVASTPRGRSAVADVTKTLAVASGFRRSRLPQTGDDWRGCDDARAAGTTPIYRGESGYRTGMDGDNDGIACEPYRGQ